MGFNYLKLEKAPKVIVEAYKLIGTKEVVGKDNNPKILAWADALDLEKQYTNDDIPWCGLFVAYVCFKADKEVVKNPLWARNWLNWGTKQEIAKLGDILVFSRGATSGHVGYYVGEDKTRYFVLGGNQGDSVSVVPILKSRLLGIRRTKWSKAEPKEVRQIFVNNKGLVTSINEQ